MNKSPYQNSERARCPRFGAAARREEGEYPLWIFDRRATPQQRQRSATRRAVSCRAPVGVAPQSESALAILLRRALPAARQKTARPFPIYELGSSRPTGTVCLALVAQIVNLLCRRLLICAASAHSKRYVKPEHRTAAVPGRSNVNSQAGNSFSNAEAGATPCSAELHSAVSQICNLRASVISKAARTIHPLPSATRRYSRLLICATPV